MLIQDNLNDLILNMNLVFNTSDVIKSQTISKSDYQDSFMYNI